MAKRKIIKVDESLCNGCGNCITGCAEGALAMVDGKAKVVKESFCDGMGDCIGECPTGALTIVEREAEAFDPEAVKQHLATTQGPEAVKRMEAAAERHAGQHTPPAGGCPGMRMRTPEPNTPATKPVQGDGLPPNVNPSALQQWPVQLHLVQPNAPFFDNKELAIISTCSPVASADIHWRFMKGRSVVMACPKLDRTDPYVEKLAGIFANTTIPRAMIVRMEVPCCGGLTRMVREAVDQAGRTDLTVDEVTVGLNGDILATNNLISPVG